MSIWRHTTRVIELIPNLVFVGLYGITMLSPFVSPVKSQIPALFNLAFPAILAVLLFLWFVYLIRGRWIYFLFYTLLMLFSSGYILAYLPLNFGKRLSPRHDIRIMTYNVESFLERDKEDRLLAPQLIERYQPDIIALQEATIYPDQFPVDTKLSKLFPDYPYVHIHRTQALLSKYPIAVKSPIEYKQSNNGSCSYIIKLPDNRELFLVNNHMESYSLKDAEKAEYKSYLRDLSLKELPRQLLKIKRRLGPSLNQRAANAETVERQLHKGIDKYHPDVIVVLGDLNDTPMSYTYSTLRNGLRDAYKDTGLGLGVSYNERLMPFRIDHIFYGGDVKVIGTEIPTQRRHSDHNPLIADFIWRN